MARPPVRITYVGHSTVLVEMDGVRLLTDPLLRRRLMHLRRADEVEVDALRGVDSILISHLHFDHLDLPSLRRLGRELPLVVPRGAGEMLQRGGFGTTTELGFGEETRIGSVTIRATPAIHAAGRRPLGPTADPVGYLITGSRSVYFAGDTDLFEGMAELAPVDVALLPIWGWGRTLGPGHLDPRTAAQAARVLKASVAIPIHWGTYFPIHSGLREIPAFVGAPADQFASLMAATAPETEVRVLAPGTGTEF